MNNYQNIQFNTNILNKEIVQRNNIQVKLPRKKASNLIRNRIVHAFIVSMFIFSLTLTGFIVARFLTLRINMASKSETILNLERKLDRIKEKNDSLENAIDTKFDFDELFNTAVVEFGMKIPAENEIIKFNKSSGEYVRQYENIR